MDKVVDEIRLELLQDDKGHFGVAVEGKHWPRTELWGSRSQENYKTGVKAATDILLKFGRNTR